MSQSPVSPTEDFEKMLDAFERLVVQGEGIPDDKSIYREWCNRYDAARSALLSSYREMKFSPLGDNHHNAALCPHCGEPLRKALAQLASLRLELSEARERQLTDKELEGLLWCLEDGRRYFTLHAYHTLTAKLRAVNANRESVHNHGPSEGPGLACPERIVDGKLRGDCMASLPTPTSDVK